MKKVNEILRKDVSKNSIKKNKYKDLMIYFTTYVHSESMKILSLYYHELLGKIEEHEGKNYLMVDDYMLDKVLDKIKKMTGIKNLMLLRF